MNECQHCCRGRHRSTVGLSSGAVMNIFPEGGARAFSVIGSEGRLEIMHEARTAIVFPSGAATKVEQVSIIASGQF